MNKTLLAILLTLSTLCLSVRATAAYPWSDTFATYGLSDSISSVALAVSGGEPFFNDSTRTGLWALTPPVAIRYGLTVNSRIDQRYDPLKAADAAARYISDLIAAFDNDTASALAAYTLGPALLRDSVSSSTAAPAAPPFTYTTAPTLDSICHHTSGMETYAASPVRISAITQSAPLSLRTFRLLNPTILSSSEWIMPGTAIYLPDTAILSTLYPTEKAIFDSISDLRTKLSAKHSLAMATAIKKANAEVIYRVKSGDTLGHIARRYNVTVRQIKKWNNLKSDMIRIGQRLKIHKN